MNSKPRRWIWLLALAPLALGVARLRLDVEVLNLLPPQAPAVQGLKLYQENFSNARELIISVRARDADATEAAARAIAEDLRTVTNLAAEVTWQPPWLEEPALSAELVAHLWLNQPAEIFHQMAARLTGGNAAQTLAATRERLATSLSPSDLARLGNDPFNLMELPEGTRGGTASFGQDQELFVSSEGDFRILFVQASRNLRSYRECKAWFEAVQTRVEALRAGYRIPHDTKVRYTGRPAFVSEIAGGMERDITGSVLGTFVIIAGLFWWAHGTWRPLLWLVALLGLILGSTLALGGLIFGTLSVVSVGFAAILLGLAVDYGLVLYQEHRSEPRAPASELRRKLAPGIAWSAVTTAGAFALLNWAGLPGLAQLGSLVAIGITLAAFVMVWLFLPPLIRAEQNRLPGTGRDLLRPLPQRGFNFFGRLRFASVFAWIATLVIGLDVALILSRGWPRLDHTADALRPRSSPAYAALEEIKQRMKRTQEPLWLIVSGSDEQQVARRLDEVQPVLARALSNQAIAQFTLPDQLWPHPDRQRANRAELGALLNEEASLRQLAVEQGFNTNALALTEAMFSTWRRAFATTNTFWPTNRMSHWVLEKFTARAEGRLLALGLVHPGDRSQEKVGDAQNFGRETGSWADALPREEVWLAGWEQLGLAILEVVQSDLVRVVAAMMALLLISLWLAFRRAGEVLLSLVTLVFSGLCLLALMKLMGWSWNLLNLTALPLLLGSGVDYGIHVQLALRRHAGDIAAVWRGVGRALLLCAATTVAGFGSLAWSSNAGLASLGKVCATGIACSFVTATFLLPVWWRSFFARRGIET